MPGDCIIVSALILMFAINKLKFNKLSVKKGFADFVRSLHIEVFGTSDEILALVVDILHEDLLKF